jgi:hypothetical protein
MPGIMTSSSTRSTFARFANFKRVEAIGRGENVELRPQASLQQLTFAGMSSTTKMRAVIGYSNSGPDVGHASPK